MTPTNYYACIIATDFISSDMWVDLVRVTIQPMKTEYHVRQTCEKILTDIYNVQSLVTSTGEFDINTYEYETEEGIVTKVPGIYNSAWIGVHTYVPIASKKSRKLHTYVAESLDDESWSPLKKGLAYCQFSIPQFRSEPLDYIAVMLTTDITTFRANIAALAPGMPSQMLGGSPEVFDDGIKPAGHIKFGTYGRNVTQLLKGST